MTANEIRELSLEELDAKVKELKQELFNLKFQKTLGQLRMWCRRQSKNHGN